MSRSLVTVELPEPVLEDAAKLAQSQGLTVASWISSTVEERLRDERQTAEFYRRRALAGDGSAILAILDKAPDGVPMPGDEL